MKEKDVEALNLDKQKMIWNKNWQNRSSINPHEILYSRFALEAYQCLKRFIDAEHDKLILEAGCGTGRLCCLLAQENSAINVIGVDIAGNALKTAERLKGFFHISNVDFEKGDIFRLPFSDNYFDVVFNEGVIEHFRLEDTPNYIDALREMIRVARHGGKVIIAVPNWFNFPHLLYKKALHMLGREYKYGYEKSFKHSDLVQLFLNLRLEKLEILGFYPAHGFYRLAGNRFHSVFKLLGKITDSIRNVFVEKLHFQFDRKFGIEIMIKGIKQ